MLIHGGTISTGASSTFFVRGAYWMSCISSFWKITLPGVSARLRPTSNIDWIGLADLQIAAARLDVLGEHLHAAHQILRIGAEGLAQQLGIGQHEI